MLIGEHSQSYNTSQMFDLCDKIIQVTLIVLKNTETVFGALSGQRTINVNGCIKSSTIISIQWHHLAPCCFKKPMLNGTCLLLLPSLMQVQLDRNLDGFKAARKIACWMLQKRTWRHQIFYPLSRDITRCLALHLVTQSMERNSTFQSRF